MRDVDGRQVVQAVMAQRPSTPVYLLTGYEVALGPEEVARAGATGVVAKPVSYDALAAVLGRHGMASPGPTLRQAFNGRRSG
ncbi:MAG: response regulator [Dehalococcoidia bacterium]|nr:response regulator [Dehalococcoidia bacterium]